MNKLLIISVMLCFGSTAAFSQGGGAAGGLSPGSGTGLGGSLGSRSSSATGGASGTNPATPGTNSLGTTLSSGGAGGGMKGPPLGTGNPSVDREDKQVAKIVNSVCRGC